ncbi:Hypothetical predicted protein [Cloeon dipterum]|uniref:Ig-like domain-containing protein n=2 Tax=Cloeon dipterum TaxID=197152 RepID=A0A8S1C5R2_9INSE|nr:Hypothetical predicted protein [Cloeon dipterum]
MMLCSTIRLRTCIVPILLALCTASVHSQSAPSIIVEPKNAKVVKIGDTFEFLCKASKPIMYCSIKNTIGSLNMRENTKKDSYEYFGKGFQLGDCGIKFLSVTENLHGNISCTVGLVDNDLEGVGHTNLIVAIPPNSVQLSIDKNEYKEKEEIVMSCRALGGRPAPTVTLYLGNDTLATSKPGQDIVNHNRQADYKDNNKKVICKATHMASSKDDAKMTERNLIIQFRPQPINNLGTINKFGFFEGVEGIITLDIFANPRPSKLAWKVDNAAPDLGLYYPLNEKNIVMNDDGSYAAKFRIYKVSREDVDKTFTLTATNQLGSETYNVKISFDPTPKEEETSLGAGSIVAIIVAVLIVFVAIVLTLFARTTGRWCFAAGVPAQGDKEAGGVLQSSDTESADKVAAVGAGQHAGIRIRNYLRDKINSFKTSSKVPTSEEEAKDAEAAEQKTAPPTASDGVVYAELELRKPGDTPVIRDDGEKTEYAQIVIPAQNAAKV